MGFLVKLEISFEFLQFFISFAGKNLYTNEYVAIKLVSKSSLVTQRLPFVRQTRKYSHKLTFVLGGFSHKSLYEIVSFITGKDSAITCVDLQENQFC